MSFGSFCGICSFVPRKSFATGIRLQWYGEREPSTELAASFGAFVCDEVALAEALLCKGHGGWKPCLLCRNVILTRWFHPTFSGSEFYVSSATTDISKLDTDDTIRDSLNKLAELKPTSTAAVFAVYERVIGFNYSPQGCLAFDPFLALALASSVIYERMHVYMVGGLEQS